VLDRGLVVADDSPHALKRLAGGHRLDLQLADAAAFQTAAATLTGLALSLDPAALRIGVPVAADAASQRALLDQIDPDRTAVRAFMVRAASLDEVFLALTGHDEPAKETANV
jgi:ABC-2 type transport system ATP-binding protein